MFSKGYCLLLIAAVLVSNIYADTPANCTYEDIRGTWKFIEGPRGFDKQINCSNFPEKATVYQVELSFPDIAIDNDGNIGFWTLIYNQGFEVVINNRKFFAFSYYRQDGDNVTSFCNHTFVGTSHDVGVDPSNWSCWAGDKDDDPETPKTHTRDSNILESFKEKKLYKPNNDFVEKINKQQRSWRAGHYKFMNEMTVGNLVRMAGGKKSRGFEKPKPADVSVETRLKAAALPNYFDWRNVSGVNYVSPIRNQGSCGSCYAFGSMALHEARVRIKTGNVDTPVFSTQDIVECSPYSQGCDGGFPYLVSGKYAEDYGLVDESCNPYTGLDGTCKTNKACGRQYGTNYHYIGGFYGACNEALMRIALVQNGPIAVSFEVYDDFLNYQGGVYHHTGVKDYKNFGFNPWEITNHVVLIVGYGTEETTREDYWIVKNSWGTGWGEDGFFRILRGSDECSIESIAVEADPMIPV